MTPETDKELLESAARAYFGQPMSYATDFRSGDYYYQGEPDGILYRDSNGNDAIWNPLTDDGDALRLAVKLEFRVEIHHDASQPLPWIRVVDRNCRWEHIGPDEFADDPYAATRRAIVRAAAEIGRRMK